LICSQGLLNSFFGIDPFRLRLCTLFSFQRSNLP